MKLEMYAIYKMIYETCGEDRDTFENAEITKIDENTYHITYKPNNPYDGVDFRVKIELIENPDNIQHRVFCHYEVFHSVYGDDGEFDIDL